MKNCLPIVFELKSSISLQGKLDQQVSKGVFSSASKKSLRKKHSLLMQTIQESLKNHIMHMLNFLKSFSCYVNKNQQTFQHLNDKLHEKPFEENTTAVRNVFKKLYLQKTSAFRTLLKLYLNQGNNNSRKVVVCKNEMGKHRKP